MNDGATVVREYERVHGDTHVESVTIVRTRSPTYPSGWKYSLHYGRIGGDVLLRYDNAQERTKGHERHTSAGVQSIAFPGMESPYRRFRREIEALPPATDAKE